MQEVMGGLGVGAGTVHRLLQYKPKASALKDRKAAEAVAAQEQETSSSGAPVFSSPGETGWFEFNKSNPLVADVGE